MREPHLIDISQPVSPTTGAWPGDTPFSFRWTWSMREGSSCNVSAVTASPHVGTHADAPLHFDPQGPSIADVELRRYVGPCWVLDGPRDRHVEVADLDGVDWRTCSRLLIRTCDARAERFPREFVALTPAAARRLADEGADLVGLDTPSMDPFDSKELPAHKVLAAARIAILENLVLAHVEPGPYELLALPLRWEGLDASPVRAVLRPVTPRRRTTA
jgi:arylformamidase